MLLDLRKIIRQPFVGQALSVLALVVFVQSWRQLTPATDTAWPALALSAIVLSASFVATSRYPVHIRYRTKIYLGTVPLYLMVTLLPSGLAALAAGSAMLIDQILSNAESGNSASDIATAVSRMVIIAALGGWTAECLLAAQVALPATLFATAVVLFVGDMLLGALEIAAMSHEPLTRLFPVILRESWAIESVQYLLGILGALVATTFFWAPALLVPPVVFVYLASKDAKEMHVTTRRLLESIADTVDLRDPYTGGHSRRVAELCRAILNELPIYGPEADLIVAAARVHDIGKIALPDQILHKSGPLTPEERAVMQSHALRGAEFLARYHDFKRAVEIVQHHHEFWDGRGYPAGLAGTTIPFGARVIAVADSFDAMVTDRPYRRGLSVEQATQILRNGRGEQWDAEIIDALLRNIEGQTLPYSQPVVLAAATPQGSSLPEA
jgi:putative nucleotidyltransferase with HDIG domain